MATLHLVKTDSETDPQYLLQGTGDRSQNADFSLYACDGEGGDPFSHGVGSWEIVDGVASDDYNPEDSDTFWAALDTVLKSAKTQGIRLPDYVDGEYKLQF